VEKTVELTRVFAAPRERVFEAWTRPEQLSRWFGPKGFEVHSVVADPRPGGVFRMCMRSPDGREFWVRGSYREVVANERLEIFCTADDDKGVQRLEEIIQVRFSGRGNKTTLKVNAIASGLSEEAQPMLKGMKQGWSQTVARLDDHLKET
jgi:uncharacterized protein YndB with AHSA1/START domain